MKKFFTSVAVALASFSFANAQVPSKISYQGVTTKKNQTVQVEFTVRQNNNPVYTEIQSVKTNANGLFATKIGEATGWDAIAWEDGNISVLASVDGILASAAEVTAVPYAKVAQSYVGQDYIEQDVADLVMANRENKTDIAEMKQNYANHLENLDMIAEPTYKRVFGWEGETEEENVVGLVDQVAALQEGADVLSTDLNELVMANRERATEIAEVKNDLEATTNLAQSLSEDLYKEEGLVDAVVALQELNLPNVVENLDMLVPQIEAIHENLEALTEGADVHSTDIENLVLANRENKTDIAEMKLSYGNQLENLEMVAEPTYKRVFGWEGETEEENVVGLVDQVAALQSNVEILFSEDDGPIANLTTGFTQLSNVVSTKADAADLEATTNLAQSISEDLYKEEGIVDAVVALQELNLPNVVENLDMLVPQIETIHENIDKLQEGLAVVEEDMPGLRRLPVQVLAAQGEIAELKDYAETNIASLAQFQASFYDEIMVPIQEAIEAVDVTNEVQGLSEAMRGKANVEDVADLKAQVESQQDIIQALIDALAENGIQVDLNSGAVTGPTE